MSNTKSSNQTAVPEAKGALDRFKFEVANELGVPLTDGYNGNLTSKQNGSVGGYMVKKIVSEQPLNFNSIFYIIPRVIVNYRTTFPGISLLIFFLQSSCKFSCFHALPVHAKTSSVLFLHLHILALQHKNTFKRKQQPRRKLICQTQNLLTRQLYRKQKVR